MPKVLDPERHALQHALVLEMADVLRRWLAGSIERADVAKWAQGVWPPGTGQAGPFRGNGEATTVFDSIYNMNIEEVVRPEDARMYLRLLSEGASFVGDPASLLMFRGRLRDLPLPMPELSSERWWWDGLGWYEGVRFGSPATGRAFFAFEAMEAEQEHGVSVNLRRGDDPMEAVADLLETLGLDDRDVVHAHESVRLDTLPAWELWRLDDNGNEVLMATFRSRSKASATGAQYEARGHKQTYVVRPGR